MPTLRQCAEDKSWRVRYMVADKFTELQVIGLLLFFFRIYEYMIQLCCCFSVRITNIWCNHLSVACPGCCWKRDHKDRPGASFPISPQRLRSWGRVETYKTIQSHMIFYSRWELQQPTKWKTSAWRWTSLSKNRFGNFYQDCIWRSFYLRFLMLGDHDPPSAVREGAGDRRQSACKICSCLGELSCALLI